MAIEHSEYSNDYSYGFVIVQIILSVIYKNGGKLYGNSKKNKI